MFAPTATSKSIPCPPLIIENECLLYLSFVQTLKFMVYNGGLIHRRGCEFYENRGNYTLLFSFAYSINLSVSSQRLQVYSYSQLSSQLNFEHKRKLCLFAIDNDSDLFATGEVYNHLTSVSPICVAWEY